MTVQLTPRDYRHGVATDMGPFTIIPNKFLEQVHDRDMLAVYVLLRKYANAETGEAYPSMETLAKQMGLSSPRMVKLAVKRLRELGWLTTFRRYVNRKTGEVQGAPGQGFEPTTNGYIVYTTPHPPVHIGTTPTVHMCPVGTEHMCTVGTGHICTTNYIQRELDPVELEREGGVQAQPPQPPHETGTELALVQSPSADAPGDATPVKKANRGTRLPEGWGPPVDVAVALEERFPGVDMEWELEKFRDYWASQPGRKGVKADWVATWRNWIRRAAENTSKSRPSKPAGAANPAGWGTSPDDWLQTLQRPHSAPEVHSMTEPLALPEPPEDW